MKIRQAFKPIIALKKPIIAEKSSISKKHYSLRSHYMQKKIIHCKELDICFHLGIIRVQYSQRRQFLANELLQFDINTLL